jgi:hypothetical protein
VRRIWLAPFLEVHEPHDGPPKQGYVDLPIICGGGGTYEYVERTYRNLLKIRATLQGYESPQTVYTINGHVVPLASSALDLPCTWDHPRTNPLFVDLYRDPPTAQLLLWNPSTVGEEIDIGAGPNAGNVHLTIAATVRESFDPAAGGGSTQRSMSIDVDLQNQEIVWGSAYQTAMKNCERMKHLTDNMAEVLGPPHPGDPVELNALIERAVREDGPSRHDQLLHAAEVIAESRPEVSAALQAMARDAD